MSIEIASISPGAWLWPVAGASFAIGIALLLWGGKLHRSLLILIGAVSGTLIGRTVGLWLGVSPVAGAVSGGVTLALFGLAGARLIWAVLGSLLVLAMVSWFTFLKEMAGEVSIDQTPQEWLGWIVDLGKHMRGRLENIQGDRQFLFSVVIASSSAVGALLAGLWRPRLASILITSLLGATGTIFAVMVAAERISPGLWAKAVRNRHVLVLVGSILMLAGLLFQYRRLVLGQKQAEEEQESDEAPKRTGKSKKPSGKDSSAGKSRKGR